MGRAFVLEEDAGLASSTPSGPWSLHRSRLAPALILALSLLVLCLASHVMAEDLVWKDRTVTGTEAYNNTTILLDGNLTVASGGRLELNNVTVTVNATEAGQYVVLVEGGGTLELKGVNLYCLAGTYGFVVRGTLVYEQGEMDGLRETDDTGVGPAGLEVRDGGVARISDAGVFNLGAVALTASDGASVSMDGGIVQGGETVIRVDSGARVTLEDVRIVGDSGSALIDVGNMGEVVASNCSITSVGSSFVDVTERAVSVNGSGARATLDHCEVETLQLAKVLLGSLWVKNGTHGYVEDSGAPDLVLDTGNVEVHGLALGDVELADGVLWLYDATIASATYDADPLVRTVGITLPPALIDNNVTVQHHWWVHFRLLNETEVPVHGLDLRVYNSSGATVVNTVSATEGWVLSVPVRSWTWDGRTFRYEPSHRVEFGETDFQITNLQVYDNTTVQLWNSPSSRDLALDTDIIGYSTSTPRANRSFNVMVDGETLVPIRYPSGTASIDLYVDDELVERRTFDVASRADVVFVGVNLTEGPHLVQVVVDPLDEVEEMNEGGNNILTFIIEVAPEGPSPGDLVDLTVSIRRIRDTAGNEGETLLPGVLFVDFTIRAVGASTWPYNIPIALYVDDRQIEFDRVNLLTRDGSDYIYQSRFSINLPRGEYDISVVVDPNDVIAEEREHNNDATERVTLDPDLGDDGFWDPACCSAIFMIGLVVLIGLLGAYAQRRQRQASGAETAETVQYPSPSTYTYGPAGGQARGGPPPAQPRIRPTQAKGIEDRWTTERFEQEMTTEYRVDGSPASGAERVLITKPKASPKRERYQVSGVPCPRCGGSDIVGFGDGSAKCQSCKKIFYPGRR